jgi:hypothetical protein
MLSDTSFGTCIPPDGPLYPSSNSTGSLNIRLSQIARRWLVRVRKIRSNDHQKTPINSLQSAHHTFAAGRPLAAAELYE